ncbi:hypothetical protein NBT05_18095 [Aquimarina sp. ERC-38]|uniref:glycoside hydrolase family 113 n=1 Tax=Aquimarina sp. ERC-38 TaxID=2949996 RepID=UPI0022458CCA|nr:hypothetical protein [Aquimarina sp. ERC-38]UZO80837.1 hypothetical protein NBT05_18095 [Aquimarina sp. ERC-38]
MIQKSLRVLIWIISLFFVLFITIRVVVLGINKKLANVSLTEWFSPLFTTLFWNCLGVLLLLLAAYGARILIVKHYWYKYKKSKAILYSVVVIGSIFAIIYGTLKWVKINDQKTEYHYTLPAYTSNLTITTAVVNPEWHRGANVFGWEALNKNSIDSIRYYGITHVAVLPFEYQSDIKKPSINHIEELPTFRKKDSTMIEILKWCTSNGLKTMLKPHLWVDSGWRTEFDYNEEETKRWFKDYRKLALNYARIAQEGKASVYCFGTEFYTVMKDHEEKWLQLIKEIRAIYKGKLTYAANWDKEYQDISFWKALDYIGVQGYFPMKIKNQKSLSKLKSGLQPYLDTLADFSTRYNKPVLFTEFGFRSIEDNTDEPWAWFKELDVLTKVYSEADQELAYRAFLSSVMDQPWCRGAYFWEYDINEDDQADAIQWLNFSPRHKKTAQTISEFYQRK